MQITVKQLSKSYKDKTILDNITFTIESGTVSGLLWCKLVLVSQL